MMTVAQQSAKYSMGATGRQAGAFWTGRDASVNMHKLPGSGIIARVYGVVDVWMTVSTTSCP